MSKPERSANTQFHPLPVRDWFAASLGVKQARKRDIYIEISKSAALGDVSYWLQTLFSAGIATLGLILNSAAVIIGAMLISPLMGPILAAGLALASGDVILGIRSVLKLAFSCALAVSFAVLLVALLPFKEITAEISARTQPNTLDLFVALFSGAIGSIAICKEVKGVATSIPGVAIAVALMPPLCVAGYGIGIALSLGPSQGIPVASGGGLLFLTNLVAITVTAMVVFLLLHIDTDAVRQGVKEWSSTDREISLFQELMGRFRVPEGIRRIGSLPGRSVMIAVPFVLILIPLSQSLSQLRAEIARQQNENRIKRSVTQVWQDTFGSQSSGESRSYLDQVSMSESDGKLMLALRVFTSNPYTSSERAECRRLVASRLGLPQDKIGLQLIEIPTTSAELALRKREEKRSEPPPAFSQLHASFVQGAESALRGLHFPPPAHMIGHRIITGTLEPPALVIAYLSERDISEDGTSLIEQDIHTRLGQTSLVVAFERVPASLPPVMFRRQSVTLAGTAQNIVDQIGELLHRYQSLEAEIPITLNKGESEALFRQRLEAVFERLTERWQVDRTRLKAVGTAELSREPARVKLIAPVPAH